ncbi:MAG TPA: preprotein translocase subunit SecY, partial [Acidimicrobiales bacterium]|nr:preprotein translocase subunit SecY [Acidimicrobiales bacterium]
VFGLGIMPYITAEIIIQLLVVVVPKFEQWRDEGPTGQKKLTQTARYLTIALAIMQATGLAFVFHNGGGGFLGSGSGLAIDLIPNFTIPRVLLIVLTMTAGTAFVMWLGELITQRGIGQGMSIIIFANVVAGMPAGGNAILQQGGQFKFGVIIVLTLLLLVAIVFVEQGQRRVPVTFAKRVVGRRMYGGQSTYIPMKVNTGGVIPIIFASSVLYFPILISNVLPNHGFWKSVQHWISVHLAQPNDTWYIVLYGAMILLFAYFYAAITFDPHQQADVIRKQGGYIPGIRPGPPTERYLSRILNRITLSGGLYLAIVAVLPSILLSVWRINSIPFAGTTLIIAVGVSLETMKQIDSQLMMRNYEGFLQ